MPTLGIRCGAGLFFATIGLFSLNTSEAVAQTVGQGSVGEYGREDPESALRDVQRRIQELQRRLEDLNRTSPDSPGSTAPPAPLLSDGRPVPELSPSPSDRSAISPPTQALEAEDPQEPATAPRAPVLAEPLSPKTQAASSPRHADGEPKMPTLHAETPEARAQVAPGRELSKRVQLTSSRKSRGVKTQPTRISAGHHRVNRVRTASSRRHRGFNGVMGGVRYRVGRALGCFVTFRCSRRQLAGTAVGAAIGGAAGKGGGAVIGGLVGAAVASRGR
jgi:hypothetical protein